MQQVLKRDMHGIFCRAHFYSECSLGAIARKWCGSPHTATVHFRHKLFMDSGVSLNKNFQKVLAWSSAASTSGKINCFVFPNTVQIVTGQMAVAQSLLFLFALFTTFPRLKGLVPTSSLLSPCFQFWNHFCYMQHYCLTWWKLLQTKTAVFSF